MNLDIKSPFLRFSVYTIWIKETYLNMLSEKEQVQKAINTLAEIIYELYKDLLKGKLKNDLYSKYKKQAVGKSATKAKTFQQTAFKYK